MSEVKHTPLPWCSDPFGNGIVGDISTPAGETVAQTQQLFGDDQQQSRRKANTAFILRAVNSHYALIEALEQLDLELKDHGFGVSGNMRQLIAEALSLAKGEQA